MNSSRGEYEMVLSASYSLALRTNLPSHLKLLYSGVKDILKALKVPL